jgi:hypothetical protein
MPHDPHHPDVEEPDDRSEHEIRDRQMIELLNELRVALPGVQILFAFLLTVPFAAGYERITAFQKDVYYWTLIATALSTACLIAPTAAHRLRFHQRDRIWVIETANKLAIAGLAFLAVAIFGAVLLITDVLYDGARVWIYSSLVGLIVMGLWFVRPALRSDSSGP